MATYVAKVKVLVQAFQFEINHEYETGASIEEVAHEVHDRVKAQVIQNIDHVVETYLQLEVQRVPEEIFAESDNNNEDS